jgi:hypothetical protein
MANGDQPPLEQFIAHVFAAAYWLLYHEVARDLFPETRVHALSPTQDQAVTARTGAMIQNGVRQLLPPSTPPDDHRPPSPPVPPRDSSP